MGHERLIFGYIVALGTVKKNGGGEGEGFTQVHFDIRM
jgi:hypothetical protein